MIPTDDRRSRGSRAKACRLRPMGPLFAMARRTSPADSLVVVLRPMIARRCVRWGRFGVGSQALRRTIRRQPRCVRCAAIICNRTAALRVLYAHFTALSLRRSVAAGDRRALAPDDAEVEGVSEHFTAVLPRDSFAPGDRREWPFHGGTVIAPCEIAGRQTSARCGGLLSQGFIGAPRWRGFAGCENAGRSIVTPRGA